MAAAAVKGLSEENKDGQKGSSVGNVEASENKAGHSGPMSGTSKETCVSVLAKLADAEGEIMLTRVGYTTSYNPQTKQPNWVGWRLTADHVDGEFQRKGIKFHEDEDVPEPRAKDEDYRGSGYDRGHMCPSGDNKWSQEAQEQSFLFTNICPYNHGLNAGDWNEMVQQ